MGLAMYCPYFRGKQYELIAVREMAPILAAAGFRPIIEPVRESLGGLHKALAAVTEADGHAIVIVNPHHGDLSEEKYCKDVVHIPRNVGEEMKWA
jgi:hypothetical protein